MLDRRRGSVLAYAAVAFFALATIPGCGGNASPPPLQLKDSDGDQLSDAQEIDGWAIQVDRTGYGGDRAEVVWVTSDPGDADSDDDGLSDLLEFQAHSNPNDPDTDGDGIGDRAEWMQWKTNPASVDSDGDARGPSGTLPPSAMLFDGYEIERLGTSPTLADTDGDGRTDYEEHDSPRLNPLIAELPRARMEVEGEVGVRLHVAYEESIGREESYGMPFSVTANGSPRSSEALTRWGVGQVPSSEQKPTIVLATVATVVTIVGTVITAAGTGVTIYDTLFGDKATTEITNDITIAVPPDESQKFRDDWSRYQADLRERTAMESRGTISIPIRIRNEGASTFTLRSLAIGVLKWNAATKKLHGMSTLTLDSGLADGVTLAPGERSPLLIVADTDVDPATVGLFLEHPEAMVLEHAYFDLEDEKGVDYDFLLQTTLQQTALVEIDFGGQDVETHRVATNVRRRPDSGYAGVTMREVMNDILGLPSDDPTNGYTVFDVKEVLGQGTVPQGLLGLESVRGRSFIGGDRLQAFWTYITSEGVDASVSFDDIVLRAGDTLRLVYVQDADGDGLYGIEEKSFGTSDDEADFDGDGLDDGLEAKTGWDVAVVGAAVRRVFADPTLKDSDADDLSDRAEFELGTDPTDSDTDGDGLLDAVDADPLRPAITLYVDVNRGGMEPGDGKSWDTAFLALDKALVEAGTRNAGNEDPEDDVAAIWVAQGIYWPTDSDRFELPDGTKVYGGFEAGQEKLGARDADPRTNQTILYSAAKSQPVVCVPASLEDEDSRLLDGFVLLGEPTLVKSQSAMVCEGAPTLRNLLFFLNRSESVGSAMQIRGSAHPLVRECYFRGNETLRDFDNTRGGYGGAIYITSASATFEDCEFSWNRASLGGGAVILGQTSGLLTLTDCVFANNMTLVTRGNAGGALYLVSSASITGCEFYANSASRFDSSSRGGAIFIPDSARSSRNIDLTNCLFLANEANDGGAIYDKAPASAGGHRLSIVNCTIKDNKALIPGSDTAGGVLSVAGEMRVSNSILWGNTGHTERPERGQIFTGNRAKTDFEFTCIEGQGLYRGPGVSGADPKLTPQLRLGADSPYLDNGNNFVDIHPGLAGRQFLPDLDLAGEQRIVNKTVDYGCYERQD